MMKKSYWEYNRFKESYDLVVVGGGLTGLATSLYFREMHPDAKVAVLEKGANPAGASVKNAGFLCIGSASEILSDVERMGKEAVKSQIAARYEGVCLLKNLLGENAIGYEPNGGYELFTEEEKYETNRAFLAELNEWTEEITRNAAVYTRGEVNGYPYILNSLEGAIDTGKTVDALIRKVQSRGVEIYFNMNVQNVAPNKVETENYQFECKYIVMATNAFTSTIKVEGEYKDLPLRPAKNYVFVTKPLPSLKWKGTFHYNEGYVYFRNIGTQRLLLGGARHLALEDEFKLNYEVNPTIKNYLVEFATEVLKLPEGWEIDYEWIGHMAFTPTHRPAISEIAPSIWFAGGLNGMGVALSLSLGKAVATRLA